MQRHSGIWPFNHLAGRSIEDKVVSKPSEVEIRRVVGAMGLAIPSPAWAGFVVCVIRRVNDGAGLWDAVEECAVKYK
jgi:hypothetical protein